MAETRMGILGADWVNIVLGVVVAATPFFTGENRTVPYWSCLISGILVAGLAVWNMFAARAGRTGQAMSASTLHLLAGLWLVALPFVYATNMMFRWACVIEGVVLLVTSGYVAWAIGRVRGGIARRA